MANRFRGLGAVVARLMHSHSAAIARSLRVHGAVVARLMDSRCAAVEQFAY